ncbi:hypothetical protein [Lentilitoribacter sp. Alg239-R112]|uniref:hypothetical protein n=1 Tax=Lentilitoribacter sp. Alg239-R112 TaxID=2305987 RepID=UPI0013A6C863|nr:hypothetical protein [Lentilitoribacter sp. Alg239-R112]
MSQLIRIFLRFVTITFGFTAACIAAATVYAFLSGLIRQDDFETYGSVELGISLTIMLTGLSAKFAQIAFTPAFIVILIFEIKAIRDWIVYLVSAAIISIVALFAFETEIIDFNRAAIYTVSAIIGGFIYWLFVGQRAGKWRDR